MNSYKNQQIWDEIEDSFVRFIARWAVLLSKYIDFHYFQPSKTIKHITSSIMVRIESTILISAANNSATLVF